MIYLLITTSILNKHGLQQQVERQRRYEYAITETLRHLPADIQPILVENNGQRATYLDHFQHQGKPVPVIYTDNNKYTQYKSKGVNEMLDIKEVIRRQGIQSDDILIKLTGRYRILSPLFFQEVIANQDKYDAFVKFFGTCSLQWEQYDCILGCYAIRARYLQLFQPITIDNSASAEIAFARYVRFCGARLHEVSQLDLECQFAEDNRILVV